MAEDSLNDLSYKIIGAVYDVYNDIGFGYQEKYYYRAVKKELLGLKFKVLEQLLAELSYKGGSIGRYFLDFLINDVIVLELKVANKVHPKHVKQVLGYLKAKNLKLDLVAVIAKEGVLIKRVIN